MLASVLVTVETGELVGKDEAADRVLPRFDDWDAYHGPDYGSFEDLADDLGPCADALVAAIDAAVASRGA